MKIVINDTNIFIDLHSVGLLDYLCKLPYDIRTVDFVIEEIENPDQKKAIETLVESGRITVAGFTAIELSEIVEEHMNISGNLSIPDCSVCYYARKHRIPMLTGDRQLRNYAVAQNVEVHGILFVFDQLVAHSILSPAEAANKLEQLYSINVRLPKSEIMHRLRLWG